MIETKEKLTDSQKLDVLEKELREYNKRTKTIFKNLSEVIAVIDEEGIITFESESVEILLGYSRTETIGSCFLDRAHPDDRDMLKEKLNDCLLKKNEKVSVSYRMKHKNGKWLHLDMLIQNLFDVPYINGYLVHFRDRTEIDKYRQRAYYFEFNDQLTGLPNKEMFINRLQRELHRCEKNNRIFAVMSIGLNRFKYVNSIYGIAAGDKVLRIIGEKLKSSFRDDDLVSRFDGDRFTVLLSDLRRLQHTDAIFRKASEIFSEPLLVDDKYIRISAGIGISFFPQDGVDSEGLLKNSESAMFNAKKKSVTSYSLYDDKQNKEMLLGINIEKELQEALFLDQFKVFYQPKVNNFGRIIGKEALVRWQSPDRGLVPPGVFIPIAEKSGLIKQLGRHVLYESCVQNRKWSEKGNPLVPVAVNISPFEFNSDDIVKNIKDVLKETGLGPQNLEIEITESGIMENEQEAIEKLSEIHDMNVSISIDDFGTGYSSLSKLKDYPIDKLKIDKSFVDNFPADFKSNILVNSIIGLAHNLEFKVIAEGVEEKAQFDYLKKAGCDQYQGYFFSKPVDADTFWGIETKSILI